jgi:hypothetical protein
VALPSAPTNGAVVTGATGVQPIDRGRLIVSPQPSIGRIVHYHSYGTPAGEYLPEPRAAIVTAVEPTVALCVLNPTGMFFNVDVPFAEEPTPGHWSWPPRV